MIEIDYFGNAVTRFGFKEGLIMPASVNDIAYSTVRQNIDKLIDNLVNITDETGEFLLKLEDGRVIDTKGWNDWEWTHGIGLYGLLKYWDITGDDKAREIIEDWFANRFAEGTPTKNVNTMSPFLTLAYMQERTGNRSYLPYLDVWAEWIMDGIPRTEENGIQHIVFNSVNYQQMWDDTLMMSVMPLAKIGLLLDRPHYVEEAKRQFMVHTKYLADRKTGLWFHGWTFDGRHNFADALWARGNCWVTIAIPEFIELLDLPETDALRLFLIETLEAQVKALVETQHESGLWHTLLDDPTSYLEASAAAGFAYGILKAVRKGYISDEYRPCAEKAIKAVLENIDETGELQQVSFGTPVFDTLQGYKDIPLTSMPYGQSMAILALVEYMNAYI
ncbi:beta-galactosidase BglB [Alteromonas sp. RKMC-009]|uniref:beta-galactosidase BglB n=1 Tax=Alteromonas sp. RKMC-009 TaxID=2267264 RepID=UPI00193100A3|nr:glycoside hydrolase family 88 protein [Alteromonas sp. RKMC-009]